jgi:hypothetical protein
MALVMLRIEYEPQGFVENIGDAAGFVEISNDSRSISNAAGKKRPAGEAPSRNISGN